MNRALPLLASLALAPSLALAQAPPEPPPAPAPPTAPTTTPPPPPVAAPPPAAAPPAYVGPAPVTPPVAAAPLPRQVPLGVSPPAAPPPSPALAMPESDPTHPLAGYAGSFFLRDPHDWFILYPKGRLQIDSLFYIDRGDAPGGIDNGPKDTRPKDTIFLRRARLEAQGTFIGHFDFHIGAEFASVAGPGQFGISADNYVIVDYLDYLKLQVGQFDAPFTLENRTSDKYFDFMERSNAVRSLGIPLNKEIGAMLWGWAPRHLGFYSIGLFDGDGQNYRNLDSNPQLLARFFVSPLTIVPNHPRWMEDVWVGASFWYQSSSNLGGQGGPSVTGASQGDYAPMATQGFFTYFSSSYGNGKDAMGNPIRSHLAENGDVFKWALEANLPIKKYGLRFELIHQSVDLAEYNDTFNPLMPTPARVATAQANMTGLGYYIEAYAWIWGDVNYVETPGLELVPKLKKYRTPTEPFWGLMFAARYDHVDFDITGEGKSAPLSAKDPAFGHYAIDALELGVNFWASKHVRLTANYVANFIGGFSTKSKTDMSNGDSSQIRGNLYYGSVEHELLMRLGINL